MHMQCTLLLSAKQAPLFRGHAPCQILFRYRSCQLITRLSRAAALPLRIGESRRARGRGQWTRPVLRDVQCRGALLGFWWETGVSDEHGQRQHGARELECAVVLCVTAA